MGAGEGARIWRPIRATLIVGAMIAFMASMFVWPMQMFVLITAALSCMVLAMTWFLIATGSLS